MTPKYTCQHNDRYNYRGFVFQILCILNEIGIFQIGKLSCIHKAKIHTLGWEIVPKQNFAFKGFLKAHNWSYKAMRKCWEIMLFCQHIAKLLFELQHMCSRISDWHAVVWVSLIFVHLIP